MNSLKKSFNLLSEFIDSLIEGADDADVLVFLPLYSIRDWAKELEAENTALKQTIKNMQMCYDTLKREKEVADE